MEWNDNKSKCKYLREVVQHGQASICSGSLIGNKWRALANMSFYTSQVGKNIGFISSSVYRVVGVKPTVTQCMLEEYSCWTKGNVLIDLCRRTLLWTPTRPAGSQGKRTTSSLSDKQDTHEPHSDPLKTMCHQYFQCSSPTFQISF